MYGRRNNHNWQNDSQNMCNGQDTIDYGPLPFVTDIERTTLQNKYYRRCLWTGMHLQVTVMCIPPGGEIGLEIHPDTDQFIRLEAGQGMVQMGHREDALYDRQKVCSGDAVCVPAGTWHNITNIGNTPMKVYTLYAPPHHPHGTVQCTKADADAEENQH